MWFESQTTSFYFKSYLHALLRLISLNTIGNDHSLSVVNSLYSC